MKKISEHIFHVFVVLAGVALIIVTCMVSKEPTGEFYDSVVDKEIVTEDKTISNIDNIEIGDFSSDFSDDDVKAVSAMFTESFVTKADTLPQKNTVWQKPDSVKYFDKGVSVSGIPYSSVWREGLDVAWNILPCTFYSAANNPASVLYKQDCWDKVYNAASYYGTVCSTTVTKALGYKYPYNTMEIPIVMYEKQDHNINNLEVGDILWTSGHVAGISKVLKNKNMEVVSVTVLEQASTNAFQKVITASEWNDYFEAKWEAVYCGDRTGEVLENPVNNNAIIFERGNNTYITDCTSMLFYIPNDEVIYLTKNGSTTEIQKSTLETQVVNDVTVYDLASYFTGIGDYYFHTESDPNKMCIKVIDKGNISIENNVVTVSNYSNCRPVCIRVIELVENGGLSEDGKEKPGLYNYFDAPEGYFGFEISASFKDIKNNTCAVEKIPSHGRYKLVVYYDTGLGWAVSYSENVFPQ